MISADNFFGKAYEVTISADFTLSHLLARAYSFSSSAGLSLIFPAGTAPGLRLGFPIFYIWNKGSFTLTLKNAVGTTLTTIPAGSIAKVGLSRQSNTGWMITVKAALT